MRVVIRDNAALQAVSPVALSAYARASGWGKVGTYGAHSDVYAAQGLPELILPRTQRLGDYASVVSQLITIFARVAERDEISLYNDLVTANRDVVPRASWGERRWQLEHRLGRGPYRRFTRHARRRGMLTARAAAVVSRRSPPGSE